MAEASALQPDLRADLERVLRRIANAGKIPASGERDIRLRLDTSGYLRWYEAGTVRVPASELERGFDETAAGV